MNSSTLPPILNLIVKMSLSALPLLMKLDNDNLAMKTASSCSAEQPPLSVKVQNNASVVLTKRISDLSLAWRSDLSRTDVWYASFGSNMWRPRFLCCVQGGKVKFKTQCFFFHGALVPLSVWSACLMSQHWRPS